MRRIAAMVATALGFGSACLHDYDQFDLTGGSTGAAGGEDAAGAAGLASGGVSPQGGAPPTGGVEQGGAAGSSPIGGTGGMPTGGTGGATPTGGVGGEAGTPGTGGGCGAGLKLCGTDCVPSDDPATGCAEPSCASCPVVGGSTAICSAGACAVGTCLAGHFDCNASPTDGCEHDATTSTDVQCGGCSNDCTAQGTGFTCSNRLCRCTSAAQCRVGNVAVYDCNASGHCTCDGTECVAGEACRRSGSSSLCSCNAGAACAAGTTCCQTPAGCFDLQGDSANCGACGWRCATGTTCVSGQCQ